MQSKQAHMHEAFADLLIITPHIEMRAVLSSTPSLFKKQPPPLQALSYGLLTNSGFDTGIAPYHHCHFWSSQNHVRNKLQTTPILVPMYPDTEKQVQHAMQVTKFVSRQATPHISVQPRANNTSLTLCRHQPISRHHPSLTLKSLRSLNTHDHPVQPTCRPNAESSLES